MRTADVIDKTLKMTRAIAGGVTDKLGSVGDIVDSIEGRDALRDGCLLVG